MNRRDIIRVVVGMALSSSAAVDCVTSNSSLSVRHAPAYLTDAGTVASAPMDVARYGMLVPLQVGTDAVAYLVNRGCYVGEVPGVERWNYDFEDGVDVIVKGRTEQKLAVTRSGVENGRFVVRYPMVGGFVPQGALLSGAPHPHGGSGFFISQALSHQIAKDGTFDWRNPGMIRTIEVRQVRYDGRSLSVEPPATYDPDKPLAVGLEGWRLFVPGISPAIPDGDDLLLPISASHGGTGRKAVGLSRWRCPNGVWGAVSFTPIAFTDPKNEHAYMEPSVARDAEGRLVFAARDDGRIDRSVKKPRTAYNQDLIAWISSDSGKNWRVFVHAEGVRRPGPVSVGRTVDGQIFLAANPITPGIPGRSRIDIWPVDANGRLGESVTVCDAEKEFGKNGAYWCVDHPVSAILRGPDGTTRSVLAYRVRDPYFYPFRPGKVFPVPSKQAGAYIDEIRSIIP